MVISQTPLRISLVGGGTDLKSFYCLEDGMVLSTAIDKYVYVIVKERFDDKIYINYSQKEIVDNVDEIRHELVREAMRRTGVTHGVEITTLADIPSEGSGLGSSSSITVCLLNALYAYSGIQVTAERLAREACEIEIEICNKPIGKQDQYIAAYGGINRIIFHPDESVTVDRLPISSDDFRRFGSNLLLFFTNKTRDANLILKEQGERTDEKRDTLRNMRDYVSRLKGHILNANFDEVGKALHENWLLKKSLVDTISNHEIDEMYRKAITAGALGGKICGAGGGGFLLLYVPRDKQDSVREVMNDYRELPFMLEQYGSRIIFNQRGYPFK
jgi:D-glycero-alpha-D-manno-heptose-7-phosphate kinase